MEIRPLALEGLLEIIPAKHGDDRGYFSEIFRVDQFAKHTDPVDFVQENQSLSAKVGTVRGLHYQTAPHAQGKLVRCVAGAIFDVAVDIRHGSPTFGQWAAVELTPELNNQLWIPAGFAHGFCTLKPDSIVSYKVTDYYSPANDGGMLWNDPAIGIDWPEVADAEALSPKDKVQPRLADLPVLFTLDSLVKES
jgi:dTDP-4-dehydrorhamnose 3,5-epimerase